MQDKILQQKNTIIAGVVVTAVIIGGYVFYSSLTSKPSTASEVDVKLFSAEVRNFYLVRNNINIDDSFMKGKNEEFFNQLKSYSQDIPLKEPTGRPNPFVPYVAP